TKTTEPSDAAVFRSGQGATGTAYRDNKPVVAVEGAVSSGEFGLTAAQQKAFARDVVVAAVPVRLINSPQVVGVLTVISDQNLDETFATRSEVVKDDGIRLLEDLADKIGDGLSMEPLPS
ncbi:MAG TPA: hypothetical protein VFG00_07990, partial [Acidothermaceae bacterium]|nr:hypothetical protein [Acidothermaceae bacterium]